MSFITWFRLYLKRSQGVSLLGLNVALVGVLLIMVLVFGNTREIVNQFNTRYDRFKLEVALQNVTHHVLARSAWFWNVDSSKPQFEGSNDDPVLEIRNSLQLGRIEYFSIKPTYYQVSDGELVKVNSFNNPNTSIIQVDILLRSKEGEQITGTTFLGLKADKKSLNGVLMYLKEALHIYYDLNGEYPKLIGGLVPSIIPAVPNNPFGPSHAAITGQDNKFDWNYTVDTHAKSVTLSAITHPELLHTWTYE